MRVTIETERLIIRNLNIADLSAVYKWAGDSDVARYMIYPQYKSEEDGTIWLTDKEKKTDDINDYDLGFVYKETNELIGSGGITYHPDTDIWIIGYNIRKDFWGNGLVVEAMNAIMNEIMKTRTIHILEGEFAVENFKSQRIMEKLGMSFYKDSEFKKFDGSAHFKSKVYRKIFD